MNCLIGNPPYHHTLLLYKMKRVREASPKTQHSRSPHLEDHGHETVEDAGVVGGLHAYSLGCRGLLAGVGNKVRSEHIHRNRACGGNKSVCTAREGSNIWKA